MWQNTESLLLFQVNPSAKIFLGVLLGTVVKSVAIPQGSMTPPLQFTTDSFKDRDVSGCVYYRVLSYMLQNSRNNLYFSKTICPIVSCKLKHVWVVVCSQCRLLLLLSRFSRVRLCATLEMAARQAPPSLGFSRQEHWSGLPFPSPMNESEKWKWSRSVVSDSATPWTAAYQAPPSMGFSRQEHWSGVPLSSPKCRLGDQENRNLCFSP